MYQLAVTTPDGATTMHGLGTVTVVGRHPECEIVLQDPMSSRRHCKVEVVGPSVFVEDNNSANGTVLNGEPLRTRMPMKSGDVIQIGLTRLVLKEAKADEAGEGKFDPSLSFVSLREDLAEVQPNFDFTMAAGGLPVSAEEEATSDLTQLKRVTQRLKLLLDMGKSLGSTLDPRKVLQAALDKLFTDVFQQAERGFILLLGADGQLPTKIASDESAGELTDRRGPLSVSRVRNAKPGEESEVKVSRTVVNRVMMQKQAVLVSDVASDADYNPAMSMARLEINSVMCAPLIAGNEDLGILYIDTKDSRRRFGPDDLNLLNAVAGQLAVVIKNADLARHAAQEAASRQNLQRFLSPHLVEQVMKKEITVELGGSMKKGTVFFSDLVGFTSMAAQMRPGDVVALLNRYFDVMQEIIFSRGGTVDKTGGDQIMAFWGVLVDVPHATAMACTAAVDMQNAMFALNGQLAADATIVKPPVPLGHGIGLNTGEFIAGNIGSERKIEFTVIGNAVNLAQRLEATAGRGQVFIGQGTYEAVRERALAFRMPEIPMKNVSSPIPIYSLRGLIPPDAGPPPGGQLGMTARMEPTVEQMMLSLPCVLTPQGDFETQALLTRARMVPNDQSAWFQLLTEEPLAKGTACKLTWRVGEKSSLPALETCVVEKGWAKHDENAANAGESATSEIAVGSPDLPTKPADPFHQRLHGQESVVLRATHVPQFILDMLKPGILIPSDFTSADQIVRE